MNNEVYTKKKHKQKADRVETKSVKSVISWFNKLTVGRYLLMINS